MTSPGENTDECRLFDLPQELQDNIFDFAYPRLEDGVRLTCTGSWDESERKKSLRKSTYTPRVKPASKVNEFLVSKRFFAAAAGAYIGNQTIDAHLAATACIDQLGEPENISAVFDHATKLRGRTCHLVATIEYFQKVRSLTLQVETLDLDCDSCFTPMSDNHITSQPTFMCFGRPHWLTTFTVEPDDDDWEVRQASAAKVMIWKANVRRFGELLRPIVTQPKPKLEQYPSDLTPSSLPMTADDIVANLSTKASEEGEVKPLKDEEIPESDDEILKLLVENPGGVLWWMKDVKARVRDAEGKLAEK